MRYEVCKKCRKNKYCHKICGKANNEIKQITNIENLLIQSAVMKKLDERTGLISLMNKTKEGEVL